MTGLADNAGVPSVPHVIGRAGSYEELSGLAQGAGLGDDLVIESAFGNAGSGTFFVRGQRDWDQRAGDLVDQELKVMKRIRNVEVCIEGTVTRHGTAIGPAMTSLVGLPGADSEQGQLVRQRRLARGAAARSDAYRARDGGKAGRRPGPGGVPRLLRGGSVARPGLRRALPRRGQPDA